MSKDDTLDKVRKLLDLADTVVNEHEDTVRKVSDVISREGGKSETYEIDERDVRTEVFEEDGYFEVIMGPMEGDLSSVGIGNTGSGISITLSGEKVVLENVHDDVAISDTSAQMNNGVLTVRIPKEAGNERGED